MNKVFNDYKEEFLDSLKKLISFKSYLTDINDYPNKEQLNALKFMTELGEKEGFKTFYHPKGYYGYIEYGTGEKMIGVLGHLDVVDPGDLKKWETDPFKMEIKGDYLIGRGTIDDKGPMMLNFYVLKALKDAGVKLSKRIRLIFATDEETLWRGIGKYVEKEEKPEMGYTPDATFPVIYGEKGLLQWKVQEKLNNPNFKIYGGTSINAVPDTAFYEGEHIDEVEAHLKGHDFKYERSGNKIEVIGKSEHAMVPEQGINAISILVHCVAGLVDSKIIDFIAEEISGETNGKTLFNKLFKDKETGEITVNLGKLEMKDNVLTAYFDDRIPVLATNADEVEKLLTKKLATYGLKYERFDLLKSIYADKNSFIIKTLMDAYKKITGKNDKPYTSGGATFARAMDHIFAFGPFIDSEINSEHQPNEKINIKLLENAFDVYIEALKNLGK